MPIYEYKCKNCNTTFEKHLTIEDLPNIIYCEVCQKELVRKYHAPQVIIGGYAFDSSGNRDKESTERIRTKLKTIRELWLSNPNLRKKARRKPGYQCERKEI